MQIFNSVYNTQGDMIPKVHLSTKLTCPMQIFKSLFETPCFKFINSCPQNLNA